MEFISLMSKDAIVSETCKSSKELQSASFNNVQNSKIVVIIWTYLINYWKESWNHSDTAISGKEDNKKETLQNKSTNT